MKAYKTGLHHNLLSLWKLKDIQCNNFETLRKKNLIKGKNKKKIFIDWNHFCKYENKNLYVRLDFFYHYIL